MGECKILQETSEFDRKKFRERLRQVVKSVGGNKRAAEITGTNLNTLSKWLASESVPSVENLLPIAKAGGVTLDWLATGEKTVSPMDEEAEHTVVEFAGIIAHYMAKTAGNDIKYEPEAFGNLFKELLRFASQNSLSDKEVENIIDFQKQRIARR